jgi:hypothetical protein
MLKPVPRREKRLSLQRFSIGRTTLGAKAGANMIELRCCRDLALKLGAIGPETIAHHKAMRDAGDLLVRDQSGAALFWQWQRSRDTIAARSS